MRLKRFPSPGPAGLKVEKPANRIILPTSGPATAARIAIAPAAGTIAARAAAAATRGSRRARSASSAAAQTAAASASHRSPGKL